MCLTEFIEFKQIDESEALTGYRNWRLPIGGRPTLISQYQDYEWKDIEGPHEVLEANSGIYSYNNNYNYYNNNYCNYNYNYYNYNYYNNNYDYYNNNYNYCNYNIAGIIKQWGKVAIHRIGYRSKFARVDTIFTIREIDARDRPIEFLDWIKKFNLKLEEVAKKYNCKTQSYQDFIETIKA